MENQHKNLTQATNFSFAIRSICSLPDRGRPAKLLFQATLNLLFSINALCFRVLPPPFPQKTAFGLWSSCPPCIHRSRPWLLSCVNRSLLRDYLAGPAPRWLLRALSLLGACTASGVFRPASALWPRLQGPLLQAMAVSWRAGELSDLSSSEPVETSGVHL